MIKYIMGVSLVASLGLAGLLYQQTQRAASLAQENSALTLKVQGCDARVTNITEDKDSDNEIDSRTDDDLRNVPYDWLRQTD